MTKIEKAYIGIQMERGDWKFDKKLWFATKNRLPHYYDDLQKFIEDAIEILQNIKEKVKEDG
jgi:hypothetical protein